ncbi:MAG: hypothetical protein JRN15_20450 [Nitrososphaerota archaeon]|nr:hypothetical protein [Nitrososphaerota archaeon]
MHPVFSKRLVFEQLDEAIAKGGIFSHRVILVSRVFPVFYVKFLNKHDLPRLLRFDCTNYDFQPMAVEPVDPTTKEPLARSAWMRQGNNAEFPTHKMKGNNPFFCITGVRDYYTYESHIPKITNGRWEQHRASHRIPDLLLYISEKFSTGKWA